MNNQKFKILKENEYETVVKHSHLEESGFDIDQMIKDQLIDIEDNQKQLFKECLLRAISAAEKITNICILTREIKVILHYSDNEYLRVLSLPSSAINFNLKNAKIISSTGCNCKVSSSGDQLEISKCDKSAEFLLKFNNIPEDEGKSGDKEGSKKSSRLFEGINKEGLFGQLIEHARYLFNGKNFSFSEEKQFYLIYCQSKKLIF